MNIFSRAIRKMVDTLTRKRDAAHAKAEEKKSHWNAPHRHLIKMWSNHGRPIFGPAAQPDRAGHHVSRQTSRAYLRCRFFAGVSQGSPLMPRRDRRRYARVLAALEYRRMMLDPTNAIPDEEAALYRKAGLAA